jgi:DNA-binding LacI/PurR family transcriptional regulator
MAELLESSGIPCICTAAGVRPGNMMALQMDGAAVLERSMAHLVSRGRRNPAVLLAANDIVNHQAIDAIQRTAAAHGLRVEQSFIQPIHPLLARFAGNTVRLMMQTTHPPDSILIHDDILVESATSALRDMQIRCPEQVEVVAHANFPYITPSFVEATRIGFDVSAFLRAGLDLIDQRCRGQACPTVSRISPMFEQEWIAQTTSNRFARAR